MPGSAFCQDRPDWMDWSAWMFISSTAKPLSARQKVELKSALEVALTIKQEE